MADDLVTMDQVKQHLRLDEEVEDDAYLQILIDAALRSIENFTGRAIAETWPDMDARDQTVVAQAMLLLVGHWYANREAVGKDGAAMPMTIEWLIGPLRIWHV